MKLIVTTPLAIIVDDGDVVHLRAEDETGAFGILPGHADFLTVLSVSVVGWRNKDGVEHYVAVRGGMLEVRRGQFISIATSEAVRGDDLSKLESEVLVRFQREHDEEKTARVDARRLYLAAMEKIYRLSRGEKRHSLPEIGARQKENLP